MVYKLKKNKNKFKILLIVNINITNLLNGNVTPAFFSFLMFSFTSVDKISTKVGVKISNIYNK